MVLFENDIELYSEVPKYGGEVRFGSMTHNGGTHNYYQLNPFKSLIHYHRVACADRIPILF